MFCSNCGKEISENASFCGNCGTKIKEDKKQKFDFKFDKLNLNLDFDGKKVLSSVGTYFSKFYVDYNSVFFKWAMIIFMAIGLGEPIFRTVYRFLPEQVSDLYAVFNVLTCIILFAVFAIVIPRIKGKETIKKSNFLRVFWTVSIALNVLAFCVGNLYRYILYSHYAQNAIEILLVLSTVLLLYKNKPKYPIAHIVSALVFALSRTTLLSIKLTVSSYKLFDDYSIFDFFDIDILGLIFLVVIAFLIIYLIPKKISKWLVCIPAFFVAILSLIDLIESFSINNIIYFVIDIAIILMVALWANSCSRNKEYNYIIENADKAKKSILKVGIISSVAVIVVVLAYLLVSAIITGNHINSVINKWKPDIVVGKALTEAEWDELEVELIKYDATKFVDQFVDDYYIYDTIQENKYDMEQICICYNAYKTGYISAEIEEEFSSLSVDDSWENDSILSAYYNMYLAMKPDIDNVSVSSEIDIKNGQISVTVENDNVMPISKCSASCKFTILFVEPGSYSDNEYGRGTKTIVVENVSGKSKKTETISFNANEYYDSYGSYITAIVFEKSTSLDSIE